MGDEYSQDTKAPFNMAIATLYSLRSTLDHIRDVEANQDIPPVERQRIKIELVKTFYVDSSPLIMDEKILGEYQYILKINPIQIISVNNSNQKQRVKTIYSLDLNEELNTCLLKLQVELQKKKYYMPPSEDMGSAVAKMY